MTQQTYTPADIVQFALNKDAVNTSAAFDQMIAQRVADAVQARKIEVAKSMYGQQEVEQATADEEDTQVDSEVSDEVEVTAEVEDENNKESEESHEDAEQSA